MSGKNQHVVPHNDVWAVRGENNSKITSQHSTQVEATKSDPHHQKRTDQEASD